jgi:hypothetical protein
MVNYEFLKKIDYKVFLEYVKRGIIPVHIMDYITVYETYLSEVKNNKKSIAITYCADKYNCSENTIRNIINFMLR